MSKTQIVIGIKYSNMISKSIKMVIYDVTKNNIYKSIDINMEIFPDTVLIRYDTIIIHHPITGHISIYN